MNDPGAPSFPCADCQAPVHIVHPARARAVVCAACGAQHDLFAAGSPVFDHVQLDIHRPEGLVELGRGGRIGDQQVQVIGRIRMSHMDAAKVRMWDDWVLITSSGRYLGVREEGGNYALLIPFQPEQPIPPAVIDAVSPGTVVAFEGKPARVDVRTRAKVLHVEGELQTRVSVGDLLECFQLHTVSGDVVAVGTYDGVTHYTTDVLEDRAMWSIFGYHDILRAFDGLHRGLESADRAARNISQAATALLACSFLGGLLLLGVATSSSILKEGWARFDFVPRDGGTEQQLGPLSLADGWGFYTLDVECGLDATSQQLEVVAEAPGGLIVPLTRCVQQGRAADVGHVQTSFRASEAGVWRLAARHTPLPQSTGRAHVTWTLSWQLGSMWWPTIGMVALTVMGLITLAVYPLARRAGLTSLEEEYEQRRAELALNLRRRSARVTSTAEPAPAPGDLL